MATIYCLNKKAFGEVQMNKLNMSGGGWTGPGGPLYGGEGVSPYGERTGGTTTGGSSKLV